MQPAVQKLFNCKFYHLTNRFLFFQEQEDWRRAVERRKGRAESVDSLFLLSDTDSVRPFPAARGQSSPASPRRRQSQSDLFPPRTFPGETIPPPPRPPKAAHLQQGPPPAASKRVSISHEEAVLIGEPHDEYMYSEDDDHGDEEDRSSFYSSSGSQSFRVGEEEAYEEQPEGEYTEEEGEELMDGEEGLESFGYPLEDGDHEVIIFLALLSKTVLRFNNFVHCNNIFLSFVKLGNEHEGS